MNIRHTRLAALSPSQEGQSKKNNQNDLKEKELNLIYRQSLSNQNKPTTSYQSNYQSSQQQNSQNGQLATGLLTQSSQQKLFMQQPQSAQTIRNFSVKNSNSQMNLQSQVKQLGQENLLGAISIMNNNNNNISNNATITGYQAQQSNKNGKMQKSQSLQKNMRVKPQTGSLKTLKHFQFMGSSSSNNNNNNNNRMNNENNENAENENAQEKHFQFQMGNNNPNILNIQFNPSTTLNRLSDHDFDMKKSFANIRLPKLPADPLSGKAREKNSKNQQKLNNFVDNHMGSTENNQEEDKGNQKKNEKDPELERIKDRFKTYKNSKDLTSSLFDQKSGTPPSENQNANNGGGQSATVTSANSQTGNRNNDNNNKKDDELSKIYGGNIKSLRQNTPKQNGNVMGLKQNPSSSSLQITPQTTSAATQQSFGMTAFSTKLAPKKNSIQSLQQKQLKLFDKQVQHTTNNNHNNSSNNSQIKEENDDNQKQNKNGPLYINQYSHRTKAGCNYQGPKKNQDNFIIHPNLNKMANRYLFAVCDGHGVNGHDVSAFIRNTFPKILETLLAKDLMCLDQEYISSCLKLAFLQLSQRLLESRIDCAFSGSTFVVVLIIDDKIWCANTGDSRGILCKQTKALWNAEPLSNDHKADDPEERRRIEASGGRVDSYRDYNGDPVGPARVWMKYDDIPGLAMSRSFGDLIAAQCGVICEPDDDRFIVIASDGVWEFLNNRQVMVHVMPYYIRQQPDMACQKLVKESTSHWKQHDEVVDDITAICIFLHKNKPKLNQQSNKEFQTDQDNPFAAVASQEAEKEEKEEEQSEKINEDIDKIDEDLIEGSEDKSAGSKLQKNQNGLKQQNNNTPTSQSSVATINMKQRKEQNMQKQIQNDGIKNTNKNQSIAKQKYEQEEREVEEIIEKELNKIANSNKNQGITQKSTTPTAQQSNNNNKIDQTKSKNQQNNNGNKNNNRNDNTKKTEESSRNLIPDVDESDSDSEYSKDFELDRQRAEKESKEAKQIKLKQKKKEKSPFKGADIPQYNFEEDDGDDDAFFKHL